MADPATQVAPAPAAPAPAAPLAPAPAPAPAPAAPIPVPTPPPPSAQAGDVPVMPTALDKINRQLKEKAVFERAKQLGLNYIDVEKVPINPDLASVVPEEKAKSALVLPFFRIGKKLRIAVADPQHPATQALMVALKTQGYLLNLNIASDTGILISHGRLFEEINRKRKSQVVTQVEESEIKEYEKEIEDLANLNEKLKTVTAEEGLSLIYVGAMKTGSSDIHVQPEEKYARVRFRIDGILQKIFDMEPKVYANILNQLKFKAGMKLNINNVPQDGRDSFVLNQRKVDVRVSVLPTEYGETLVCRLLDSGKGFLPLEQCGFIGRNLELMRQAIKISHGMVLVTGPTGSGKTTTLYSMLTEYNTPERKVITLEDPIEYHLPGISQSQINEKRGYTFSSGLRSILRQDPDVVMVGEIRDQETAETAAQAALTGHVLLSTLHTNSAVETIPRLINIGLAPYMVAPSLHMIVAQRLVRKLCDNCKQKKPITDSEKQYIEEACAMVLKINPKADCSVDPEIWHPRECKKCSHTGYLGRLPIHEILVVTDEMRELILNNGTGKELMELARKQGMLTLQEDGIMKVLMDLTTLEEVQRVTQVIEEKPDETEHVAEA